MKTSDLLTHSERTRATLRGSRSLDPRSAIAAEWARRDDRLIIDLCRTAAAMAAAERKRHGKHLDPDDIRDAAQDTARAVFADGARPMLRDLIDAERPTVATAERVKPRPVRDLIGAAGACLDSALRDQHLSLDPEAGNGDLLAYSTAHRDAAEARHSIAAQVIDPAVSPLPADFDAAADAARMKAGSAERHAAAVAICGEPDSPNPRHPMTAGDWAAVKAPGYKRVTASGLRTRAADGREKLAEPKTRPSRERVQRFGRFLAQAEAYRREFSRLFDRSARRAAVLRSLAEHPTGGKHSATPIPEHWRTADPLADPAYRTRKRLPARKRSTAPAAMPSGWRRSTAQPEHRSGQVEAVRTIEEIHAEHRPAKRTRTRRSTRPRTARPMAEHPADRARRARLARSWRALRTLPEVAERIERLAAAARKLAPAPLPVAGTAKARNGLAPASPGQYAPDRDRRERMAYRADDRVLPPNAFPNRPIGTLGDE